MAKTSYESVTDYLAAQPPATRAALRRLRAVLRKAMPGAEEGISYQIPVLRLGKRPVTYFAGWKEHVSIYPVTEALAKKLGKALTPYRASKGTLKFPLDAKLPEKLIARIGRERAKETAALGKRR